MANLTGGQQELYALITARLTDQRWQVVENRDGSLTVIGDEGGPWRVTVDDLNPEAIR